MYQLRSVSKGLKELTCCSTGKRDESLEARLETAIEIVANDPGS